MKKILLVEDDFALAMGTTYTLKAEGYEVIHAKTLSEARSLLMSNPENVQRGQNLCASGGSPHSHIDLILLDVMLPDGDGFSFLEEMREKEIDTPVIFCTAVGDESNIVRGLDLGADDYVTKPYRVKELLSRIAAVIRRQEKALKQNVSDTSTDVVAFGGHTFDIDSFRLYKDGLVVDCTPAELRLLREFVRNKGIVITRNQLLERIYDTENTYFDDNTLSVYIKRLRDKLGEDAQYIKTVKGIGYRFDTELE
ncbi:DNA-binding response regulator, OmpR family, contains REC and winged-helix (wHTH) domain [Lachnospiraceae bacterium NE2001]|nr:DNA-binding response regulator, OmpR family, contains REC and winged-helix (wHTH) domain [Lachnospiraceae bacterium NE2001]